jgi:hypothetical protein
MGRHVTRMGRRGMHTEFWRESQKERHHLSRLEAEVKRLSLCLTN